SRSVALPPGRPLLNRPRPSSPPPAPAVGWVQSSETHRYRRKPESLHQGEKGSARARGPVGLAPLDPPYGYREWGRRLVIQNKLPRVNQRPQCIRERRPPVAFPRAVGRE